MISDSIPNASVALASSNPKDLAKKKRANRSAKLKQCKLDARREQWLSQVKGKGGCKEEVNGEGGLMKLENKNMPIEKPEKSPRREDGIYIDGLSVHHFSDFESSPANSPTSSALGGNDSGVNFTSSCRSSSSSSCSTNGCFSGIMSEEDEGNGGDDGCLDDWEAMADALAATEDKHLGHNPSSGYGLPVEKHGNTAVCGSGLNLAKQPFCENDNPREKQESDRTSVRISQAKCQAWRPDDTFRPQSLPNLSKQYCIGLNSDRHFGLGGSVWGCKNVGPVPTSCPICYEDFDFTDSSFVPCLCGFRLCLFCHKRILEEDGRCPGCRKQYDYSPVEGEATLDGGSLTFRLNRTCSMTTRS
ncbi:hypothetical protein SASPL_138568 [Salvia splendens]|uniref:RING-type domain-containing protein n=1 Tax=Salvia splendens TaxID=180675 RepID=A0A8X8WVP9_SALSN|nr:uncharacterized protein LOC121765810 [Salvia splendens]XP_042017989.1 uncharacterized protein LOC121765810 [Salvia splendens]XP_042017990.1 uncharacterized protein LOC121765810 [Salvia splendens]XP_042017991.1 uncharacterized protein LOC121765810 [Salvia splendens]KAG6401704.1 hypothetical protein SASPL_138568 [Salvia splendens]